MSDELDKYLEQFKTPELTSTAPDTAPAKPAKKLRAPRIGGLTSREEIDELLSGEHGEKARKFFQAVKWAEGGETDLIVGGKQRFDPNGDHPNIVGLRTADGPSTAAGDYQLTGTNWRNLKPRLGAKNFNAENQLRAALMLYADRAKREGEDGLGALRSGDFERAMRIASRDWAAVPGSPLHGGKGARKREEFLKRLGKSDDPLDTYLSQFVSQPDALQSSEVLPAVYGKSVDSPVEIATPETLQKYGINFPAPVEPTVEGGGIVNPQGIKMRIPQAEQKTDSLQLTRADGEVLTQYPDQSNLKPGEVRLYDTKGNPFVAVRNAEGKFDLREENSYSPEEIETGYQEYLKFQKLPDSPENKQAFLDAIQDGDRSGGEVLQYQTEIGKEDIRRLLPGGAKKLAALPAANQSGQSQFGNQIQPTSIGVDLTQKPAGENTGKFLLRSALTQVASKYGLTAQEIENYLGYVEKKYGRFSKVYNNVTDSDIAEYSRTGKAVVPMNIGARAINEILQLRNDASKVAAPQSLSAPETAELRQNEIASKSQNNQHLRDVEEENVFTVDFKQKPRTEAYSRFARRRVAEQMAAKYGIAVGDVDKALSKAGMTDTDSDIAAKLKGRSNSFYDFTVPGEIVREAKKEVYRRNAVRQALVDKLANGRELSPEDKAYFDSQGVYLDDIPRQQIDEAREKGAAVNQRFNELYEKYKADPKTSSKASIYASRDAGRISVEQAQELEAYQDEQAEIARHEGRNVITEAAPSFGGEDTFQNRRLTEDEVEVRVSARLEKMIRESGSVKNAVEEKWKATAEAEKYYSVPRPFGQSSEAIKTFTRYVAKLPALVLDTVGMAADLNPVTAISEYLSGREAQPELEPIFAAAESWRKTVENDAALKQNKIFEKDFIVNEVSEGLAQFATQMILVPLTGGYSLALPLAETSTAQYKEAKKAGATRAHRTLAALVGGVAGLPDVLLQTKYLQFLTPIEKSTFVTRLTRGIFTKLSEKFGKEEAADLTKVTVGTFLRKAVFGKAAESGQEYLEDVANMTTAALTYNPKLTAEEILVPTNARIRGYLAAGIVGGAGGTFEAATQKMSVNEMLEARESLPALLEEGRISETYFQQAKTQIERQLNVAGELVSDSPQETRGAKPGAAAEKLLSLVPDSPIEARQDVNKFYELGYSDKQIDALSKAERAMVLENGLKAEDFASGQATAPDTESTQKEVAVQPELKQPSNNNVEQIPTVEENQSVQAGIRSNKNEEAKPEDSIGIKSFFDAGDVEKPYSADLRNKQWEKVQKGETDEAGAPSNLLIAAKAIRSRGGLQKVEDFAKFTDDFMQNVANKTGNELKSRGSDLIKRWTPTEKTAKETEKKPDRKFSSTQINLPEEESRRILDLGKKLIPDSDLAGDGRETEPHTTVKFGLETNEVGDVEKVLANVKPFKIRLGKVSTFPPSESSDGAEVVKVDVVDSPELVELNKQIAAALPNQDSFPDYKPHVTLAYVKAGEGQKYVGDSSLDGVEIPVSGIFFSSKDRKMIEIPLGGNGVANSDENMQKNMQTSPENQQTPSPAPIQTVENNLPSQQMPDKKSALRQRARSLGRTYFGGQPQTQTTETVQKESSAAGTVLRQVAPSEPRPAFYSQVEKTISDKMSNRAPAEQVKGLLKPENQIKQKELDWLGLPEWLDERRGQPVTKDEVLEFVRQNNVQIQEVVKGKKELENSAVFDEESESWGIADGSGKIIESGFQSERAAQRAVLQDAGVEQSIDGGAQLNQDDLRYSSFVMPGGVNYKELLLTLPPKNIRSVDEIDADIDELYPKLEAGDITAEEYSALYKPLIKERHETRGFTGGKVYQSPHFDESNILAHVRFDERVDAEGKKTLFVQEIQSDWHQEGRKKGYADALKPFVVFDTKTGEEITRYSTEAEAIAKTENTAWDYDNETNPVNDKNGKVPNGPFKKSWQELSFKRILRHAVEKGFDKLAWTTGEQINDVLSISNHIDSIQYRKTGWGSDKYAVKVFDSSNREVQSGTLNESQLEANYGKELAKRIVENAAPQTKILQGLDLKVGGEGNKGFYDKIIPNFASKYVKKWGAKVGEAKIYTATDIEQDTIRQLGGIENVDPEEAKKLFSTTHSIEITPEMRESVMQGQPLFKVAEETQKERAALMNALKNTRDKSEILPDVKSEVTDGRLKVSEAGGEIMRFISAVVDNVSPEDAPPIAGLFLDPPMVESYADVLEEFAENTAEAGLDRAPLDDLRSNLLKAAENSGSLRVIVFDDAEGHEHTHKQSYDGAGRKEFEFRYKGLLELTTGKSDVADSFRKAFAEWARLENRKWAVASASGYQLGHAAEEIFTYLSSGDHELFGLTIDEATDLVIELGKRYARARIEENPALTVKEALATFQETPAGEILENIKEEASSDGQNEQSVETAERTDPGEADDERPGGNLRQGRGLDAHGGQSTDAQNEGSETGADKPAGTGSGLKERRTVLSAENAGFVEKGEISGEARYYTEKSRKQSERKAQDRIETIGLAAAQTEALNTQPEENQRAEHTALQMEVVKLLNRQAAEATDAGNLPFARAKLNSAQQVVSALAERGTDYGQAISQLAAWQKTDPEAVAGYVQKRRKQKQYEEALTPEEAKLLRASAEEFTALNNQVSELEAKIAELEKQIDDAKKSKPQKNNSLKSKISESIKKKSEEAAGRLKEKFGRSEDKPSSLKMAVPSGESSSAPLDADTLKDLSVVGAELLLEGNKGEPITAQEFRKKLVELFGENVRQHIEEIHALSVTELRNIKREIYRANAVEALKNVEGNEDLTIEDLSEIVEKQIAEKETDRKEKAKIRGEHQKEANKFFKEKETAETLKDAKEGKQSAAVLSEIPNFAKSLFKVADTQNKEALVGALFLETGQAKTADELARKLREAFPELSSREALNTASVAARSRKLAHEDLRQERLKLRESLITAEKERTETKKRRNEAQRQLLNRIRFLESPPPSYSERLGRVYKSALVSAVQTTVNNFLTAQGTRKIEAASDLAEVLINKTLAKMGKEYDYEGKLSSETRITDIFGFPDAEDYSVGDVVKNYFSDAVFARGIANSVLDEYPTIYEAMFGSYASDVEVNRARTGTDGKADWVMQKVEKVYEHANVLNYLQEFLVRSQEFNYALQLRLGAKGLNLADIIKNDKIVEEISEEDLSFAVHRALRVTFALKPDRNKWLGGFLQGYQDSVPGVVAPFFITFPNFLFNATKFVTDYAPGIGLAKAGYKVAINKNDALGQALIKEVNPRVVAQQLVGTTLFLAALGLVRAAGDDDKWYYLKTPFTDSEGKNFYIDVRGYQPFASMIFLANKVNRLIDGKTMFTDRDNAVAETLEALTGLSTRNLAENKLVQILWRSSLGQEGDEKEWDRVSYLLKQQMGEIGGGFLRPLKTVKDLIAQFDEFEAKRPDTIDRPGSQGIARSLPLANRILGLETEKNFVTGKESSQPAPILKIFGVSIINPDFHKEIPSRALVMMRELTDDFKSERDPLPESQRKARVKGELNRAMSRAGDDENQQEIVMQAIKRAEEQGILEPGEIAFIERKKGLSELGNMAKRAKLEEVERVLKVASDREKELLQPILDDKRERHIADLAREERRKTVDSLVNEGRRSRQRRPDDYSAFENKVAVLVEKGEIEEKDETRIFDRIDLGDAVSAIKSGGLSEAVEAFESALKSKQISSEERESVIEEFRAKYENAESEKSKKQYRQSAEKFGVALDEDANTTKPDAGRPLGLKPKLNIYQNK